MAKQTYCHDKATTQARLNFQTVQSRARGSKGMLTLFLFSLCPSNMVEGAALGGPALPPAPAPVAPSGLSGHTDTAALPLGPTPYPADDTQFEYGLPSLGWMNDGANTLARSLGESPEAEGGSAEAGALDFYLQGIDEAAGTAPNPDINVDSEEDATNQDDRGTNK